MESVLARCSSVPASYNISSLQAADSRAASSCSSTQRFASRNFSVIVLNAGKPKRGGSISSPRKLSIRCEVGSGTVSTVRPTEWFQKQFELSPFSRGCHIITRKIVNAIPEICEFEVGIAHIFVMHTSASLTINENASPDVPLDMEDSLNRIVPEGNHYRHLDEGLDDMPAHVKASMMGSSLTIPIKAGRLNLGIWQGIWLNEHRNYGGPRTICITIQGQKRADGRVYK
ncbi:hypothetical protein MPTK1_1g22760 [Marchantia polymorpha subsp. ruderalis]|uniref:Secondary thiamine-phosphate synthase enzyme n=2 Tax=Marchantia polymorpha TaxID=3197 RepID=A0AAF6AT81_MARPO|nr:hypothetical protein MARPO_0065s0101 [Marchantia polymorpha]BBM99651.1 hypothetical protein Mp_1g22760 [Marchantia polymorpha subsp. ruderalis]|eukprot:PTQ36307.1 hypothetical protein MARPO_0065s0101 [Marchantia polymorpha]